MVASGTITIGPGKDYASCRALSLVMAFGGTDPGLTLSGDLEIVVYQHTTDVLINTTLVTFNGHDLLVRGATTLDGNPNIGDIATMARSGAGFSSLFAFSGNGALDTGTCTFENLYGRATGADPDYPMLYLWPTAGVGDHRISYTFRNCMCDGNGQWASFVRFINIGHSAPAGSEPILKVYNNKCWDMRSSVTSANRAVLYLGAASGGWSVGCESFIENNTIDGDSVGSTDRYGIDVNPSAGQVAHVKNNVVMDYAVDAKCYHPNTAQWFEGGNASTDSSGESGLRSIVAANEFESLVDTNALFLFLKDATLGVSGTATPTSGVAPLGVSFSATPTYTQASATLADGGVAPTYVTTDLAGEAIPGVGDAYPIGCHVATA